jgi:ribonuclease HI/exonuclease III
MAKAKLSIIQWNCEGARAKAGELEKMATELRPYCICLQETKLRPEASFSIPRYKPFLQNLELRPGGYAHGGVGILVQKHVSVYQIPLQTPLQAVAVSVKVHKRITLCSLYLPPGTNIRKEHLTGLLDQLPKPYMVLGDFNARSTLWYENEDNPRGTMIVEVIAENDVFILDEDKNTHMSRRIGTLDSHIDLSICSTELLSLFKWDVQTDTRGSDHYPITISSIEKENTKGCPRWCINKADWPQFKELTDIEVNNCENAQEALNHLKTSITEAASETIPRSKGGIRKSTPIWWNRQCKVAVWKRRSAYRRLKRHSTGGNLTKFNKAAAISNKIVKASKRTSWQRLKDSITFKSNSRQVWKKINILRNMHRSEQVTTLNVNRKGLNIQNFPGESNVNNLLEEMSGIGCVQTVGTTATEDGSTDVMIRFESSRCIKEAQTNLNGRQYMGNTLQATIVEEEIMMGRQKDGVVVDDPKEIADCLGRRFAHVSSENFGSPEFREYKAREEKDFDFKTDVQQNYNSPITRRELDVTLKDVSDSAPGPDEIHYSMLKNLGEGGKQLLLDLMNKVFDEGALPENWKLAYIIPILKEGKDPEECNSYRPIALTSCICKLLERILNKRLTWFLESRELLYKYQNGSRVGRSTTGSLVSLVTRIRKAMVKKKYLISIFLDLEKAYDTCWKTIIMSELYRFGLRGKLPILINDFLRNRKFQVKVGSTLSNVYEQQMGVPQGSVLSCTLFSIGVNTVSKVLEARIPRGIEPSIHCSLYVDDMTVSVEACTTAHGERTLQGFLHELEGWSLKTGFNFSATKSEVIVFHKTRVGAVNLTLNGVEIKNVFKKMFLGVICDSHLNFSDQIAHLRDSALRSMNILKVIARYNRGSSSADLLNIYRSLVRSKLDYGSQVYGITTKSRLKRLDPVHHQAIRLCLGAYRSSPVESLYAESGELPLEYRRQMLQLQYYARTKQFKPNDLETWLDDDSHDQYFDDRPSMQPTPGVVVRKLITELEVQMPTVELLRESNYGPWEFPEPDICLNMAEMTKSDTSPEQYRQQFHAHKHIADMDIFTDGSKSSEGVGAGIVIMEGSRPQRIGRRLDPMASVFTAEIVAIKSALNLLVPYTDISTVIYSDSKSVLEAIQGSSRRGLVVEIREMLVDLATQNVRVKLCWIPSHVGIDGNELVDKVAKSATQKLTMSRQPIPVTDVIAYLRSRIYHKWKDKWTKLTDNQKLKEVRPSLDMKTPLLGWPRKDATRLLRLRIGHTRITHGYHFNGEDMPECIECEEIITVKHVLMECGNFALDRLSHYDPREVTLRELLTDRSLIGKVLLFLRQIHWYEHM